MISAIDMIGRIRVNREIPKLPDQIYHIESIMQLPFDEYNLLFFKGKFMFSHKNDGTYRLVGVKMPYMPLPKVMGEFLNDCARFGVHIELNWDAFQDKDYGKFKFLHVD